jgi:glycosyltransferase involved in cell wall biosynthesis
VSKLDAAVLLANNKAGATAVLSFPGPSVFFIHDEGNINVRRDYRQDLWSRVKFAAQCVLDFPSYAAFALENRRAMKKAALVVANSKYMANLARETFGVEPVVVYPQVDVESLASAEVPPKEERPYVMMVGHDELKGVGTFLRIARAMPEQQFLIVRRTAGGDGREENITYRGFSDDPVEHYRRARLVLMPSVCQEGFGMVAVEAAALGIPSVVSARGGLPETVPFEECVVQDVRNEELWVARINQVLGDYEKYSEAARAHAAKLDMRRQFSKLAAELELVLERSRLSQR